MPDSSTGSSQPSVLSHHHGMPNQSDFISPNGAVEAVNNINPNGEFSESSSGGTRQSGKSRAPSDPSFRAQHLSQMSNQRRLFKGSTESNGSNMITKVRMGWHVFWDRNQGVCLVVLSQFFGAIMAVLARFLETERDMHPFQILFSRQSITSAISFAYMYFAKVPDAPLGKREARSLLVARGIGGFFGVTGLYFSLVYLPIAEATVLTFLAPILASFVCSYVLKQPFPRLEQLAALVSFCGVGLIAAESPSNQSSELPDTVVSANATMTPVSYDNVTTVQRMSAIGMAMVGVMGAASAYVTIRCIGQRAHALISVNYFAVWCTIVSAAALILIPNIGFRWPATMIEWLCSIGLGIAGFSMQYLLTTGLAYEKSSRANNMVYTIMIFALIGDKLIFGTTPTVMSIVGSFLIVGSAIFVALNKGTEKATPEPAGQQEMEQLLEEDPHETAPRVSTDRQKNQI